MPFYSFLNETLPAAVLIGLRIGALMSMAPFFGDEGLSVRSKAALTVTFTILLLPVHRPQIIPVTIGGWLQAAVGETILGLSMALAVNLVFEAARLAGQIMGFQLGYSLVNIIDPQTSVDTPVMSVFTYTFALLIFLQLNVHHWILRGLAHSYEVVAPGQAVLTLSGTSALLHGAVGLWRAAVQISAPLVATALTIDVLLAFVAKASPQLPVLLVGMAMKAMAGFAVLWVAIAGWPHHFERYFAGALRLSERLQALAH